MDRPVRQIVEEVYRSQSRRVFATLVRLLGDFDLAEEALHEAFAAAMESWDRERAPKNPVAWLVSTGRFKGIDAMRRRKRLDASMGEVAERMSRDSRDVGEGLEEIEDDRLRLIFTCCHPALSSEARVALTLREVCGLTTEEVARAFLAAPATIAQRIVRAKAKIKGAKIAYEVPSRGEMPDRLDAVLYVIYLVFNEGYAASAGATVTRGDLSEEAIRLGRLLMGLLPEPEVVGLLGLMLLQESRRGARTGRDGEIVLLEEQDRSKWDRWQIEEGVRLVRDALEGGQVGPYAVQGAIAAVHAEAANAAETDWAEIAGLYGVLLRVAPSPVVELNRAVAVAMRDGPAAGLELIDGIMERGELGDYHLAHAARADLLRRLGRKGEAKGAYERALELAKLGPEKEYLRRRVGEMG